jgi:hypothetical protein
MGIRFHQKKKRLKSRLLQKRVQKLALSRASQHTFPLFILPIVFCSLSLSNTAAALSVAGLYRFALAVSSTLEGPSAALSPYRTYTRTQTQFHRQSCAPRSRRRRRGLWRASLLSGSAAVIAGCLSLI